MPVDFFLWISAEMSQMQSQEKPVIKVLKLMKLTRASRLRKLGGLLETFHFSSLLQVGPSAINFHNA